MDIHQRDDLPFPHSLPEFQHLFPDEAACATFLERARWGNGFICPCCGTSGDPIVSPISPTVLRCRHCQHNSYLTAGTVMERGVVVSQHVILVLEQHVIRLRMIAR